MKKLLLLLTLLFSLGISAQEAQYGLPYEESFRLKCERSGPWVTECDSLSEWVLLYIGTWIDSQDRDQGLYAFTTMWKGATSSLTSPTISMAGAHNPRLSFYMSEDVLSGSTIKIGYLDKEDNFNLLEDYDPRVEAIAEEGVWVYKSYDLSKITFDGPIRLHFIGVGDPIGDDGTHPVYLDNIRLESLPDYDVAITDFRISNDHPAVGDEVTAYIDLKNLGYNDASGYRVVLFRNGQEVDAVDGKDIIPEDETTVILHDIVNGDAAQTTNYYVVVYYDKDNEPESNVSKDLYATVVQGKPFVTDIEASQSNEGLLLTWAEPVNARQGETPEDVTDDFESYPAFSITNVGDWTLYDGDKQNTCGIQDGHGEFIQYDNVESPMAYQVFNPSLAGLSNATWKAHSGTQVLATFTVGRWDANDDWLISPLVDGAQTISLWARSPDATYYGTKEVIEILYSTTTNEPEAFQILGAQKSVPGTWKNYEVTLPEGTRYFAVRCVSKDQYILFLDDISYRRAASDQKFLGYNVYRNGELLTASPITEASYFDANQQLENNTYEVTAVYNTGESRAAKFTGVNTAVNSITAPSRSAVSYDLSGRKANANSRGLVITDGRKVLR